MADEKLWVCWVPVGKGQTKDVGAVVGTEWVCRQQAERWLKADELLHHVYVAPIDMDESEQAMAERPEPVVSFEKGSFTF